MTSTEALLPLNEAAEKIVQSAREIAVKSRCICVGVEHLLVALCEDEDVARKFKDAFVFDATKVLNEVCAVSNIVEWDVSTTELKSRVKKLSYTPRFKLILALASKCTKESGRTHIDESALFVAILREGRSGSASILTTSGYRYHATSNALGYEPVTS